MQLASPKVIERYQYHDTQDIEDTTVQNSTQALLYKCIGFSVFSRHDIEDREYKTGPPGNN